MKQFYTFLFISLTLTTSSCMRIANRFVYGKDGVPTKVISTPKTPSQAVSEVIQIKQTVDQYSKEVKAQVRQEKEDRYAAIQQQEADSESLSELRLGVKNLYGQIEPLKRINDQINQENQRLMLRLDRSEQELTDLKATNEQLYRSISLLTERINAVELSPAFTATIKDDRPVKAVNLGEMAIVGNTSIRKATNGTVSVRSGHTHTTYTPKSTQYYIRGPRGGCYYLTSSGRKEYVDRSLCN